MDNRGRQSKEVKYATSREQAKEILAKEPEYALLNAEELETALNTALDKKQGIKEAIDFMGNFLAQERALVKKQARQVQVTADINAMAGVFAGGSMAQAVLTTAGSGYVGLEGNFS